MDLIEIVWSAGRNEYGYRLGNHGEVRWCGRHSDADAQARRVADQLGLHVNDGTPRGYPTVEAIYLG